MYVFTAQVTGSEAAVKQGPFLERRILPAAQAARFGYASSWLGRLLSAFAE